MIGDRTGTAVGQILPHTQTRGIDLSPVERGMNRIRQDKAAKKLAADKNLSDLLNQTYAGKWADEYSQKWEGLYSDYQNIMAETGADPFTGTDPRSRDFQKQYHNLRKLKIAAENADKRLADLHKILMKNPEGTFSDESIARATGIQNMSLDELPGAQLEQLQMATPKANLATETKTAWGMVQNTVGENATDAQIAKKAEEIFSTLGDDQRGVRATLESIMAGMPDEKKGDLRYRAALNGISDPNGSGAYVQLYADFIKGHREQPTIEKFNDFLAKVDPKVSSDYTYSAITRKSDVFEQLASAAVRYLEENPIAYASDEFAERFGWEKDDTESEKKQKVREAVKTEDYMNRLKGLQEKRRGPSGGRPTVEQQKYAGEERWMNYVLSGDASRINQALAFTENKGEAEALVDTAFDEKVDRVEATNDGFIFKIVKTRRDGTPRKDQDGNILYRIESKPISEIDPEQLRNFYRMAAFKSKRNFGSNERGEESEQKTEPTFVNPLIGKK